MDAGVTLKEIWIQANYFFGQIWDGLWPVKAPLSLVMAFYSSYLGGDWLLMLVFTGMIVIDLAFGTWLAVKLRRFEVRFFGRWVVKAGTHFFVILIVGLAIKSVLEPLSISFPLLDLFLGLLICTEAFSVLKNMRNLGLPVPNLATRILADVQTRAEQTAEDFFRLPGGDRQRQIRAREGLGSIGKDYDLDDPD